MSSVSEHVLVWVRHFGDVTFAYDCDGRLIFFEQYGQYSDYGWQIDHAHPSALGGLDVHANKRPRHWRGNSSAGGILGALLSR